MTEHQEHCDSRQFMEDVETYRHDKHCTSDAITAFYPEEARDMLRALWQAAPWNFAKCMAIRYPLSAERWNDVEAQLQAQLPFSE